jgi:hypothetical protein
MPGARSTLVLAGALTVTTLTLAPETASAQRRRVRSTVRPQSAPVSESPAQAPAPERASPVAPAADAVPPASEPPPVPTSDSTPSDAPSRAPRLAALDVSVGGRWFARALDYHQDVFGELRAYSLAAAPALAVAAEWYPGAHASQGVPAWFGIIAQGSYVLAVSSRDSRAMSYGTMAYAFDVGARVRVPLGEHEVGLHVTYGQQRFEVEGNGGGAANQADPGVPAVAYQSVRLGASARARASERVAVTLGASALPLLGAGDIADNYFRRATGAGVEAQLGLSVAVAAGLEVRALVEGRRYVFAMNPQVGDRWVAGGALDHYAQAGLAVAYRR